MNNTTPNVTPEDRPESCMEDGEGPYLEFLPTPHLRTGYNTSHLLHYQLATRQPDLADDPTKQPQTLTFSFATADVVVTGQRLELICKRLSGGSLVCVRAIPQRYANLVFPSRPFVGKIEIKPITKA